jgi:hypothetical protein
LHTHCSSTELPFSKADVKTLYNELAICRGFSPEMLKLAAKVKHSLDNFEKYRRVLGHLRVRLESTIKWCEEELELIADSDQRTVTSARGGVTGMMSVLASTDGSACSAEGTAPLFDAQEVSCQFRFLIWP